MVEEGWPHQAHRAFFELSDWVSEADLSVDLEDDSKHRLHEYEPNIARTSDGRTTISLLITGPDLWTCTLTAMAVIRQSGYEPTRLEVGPVGSARAA